MKAAASLTRHITVPIMSSGVAGRAMHCCATRRCFCSGVTVARSISVNIGRSSDLSTDDQKPYVYLSGGGYFENLGLYKMVLRRCRYIVVVDARCDPQHEFTDLGNAIRKIRIDSGVPIKITDLPIYSRESKKKGARCALGISRYSCIDGTDTDGVLVYIKPAFYETDEPKDVLNYALTSPSFPHESTADQWFDESQFESYRMLGLHTVTNVYT